MSTVEWSPVNSPLFDEDAPTADAAEAFLRAGAPAQRYTVGTDGEIPLSMFVMELGIEIELEAIDPVEWAKKSGADSYAVTFTRTATRRKLKTVWSCGSAWREREITPMDVLDSLRNDAETAEGYETPEELMRDFGYDDKREAQRVFSGCKKGHRMLRNFLLEKHEDGSDDERLFRDLLDRVERL